MNIKDIYIDIAEVTGESTTVKQRLNPQKCEFFVLQLCEYGRRRNTCDTRIKKRNQNCQ